MTAPKHVMVEGPDGSGKTTLVKHLVAVHGYEHAHEGPPPPYVERGHLMAYYMGKLDRSTKPTAFDRFVLGELIYGPIFRDGSQVTWAGYEWFVHKFRNAGGIIVVCLPSYAACYTAVFGGRDKPITEFEKDPIKHHRVYEAYRRYAEDYDPKFFQPDVIITNYFFDCELVLGAEPNEACLEWKEGLC